MQKLAGCCVLKVPGEPIGPEPTPPTIPWHLRFLHDFCQAKKRMGETRPSPDDPALVPEGCRASETWRDTRMVPCWPHGRQAAHPPSLRTAPCPASGDPPPLRPPPQPAPQVWTCPPKSQGPPLPIRLQFSLSSPPPPAAQRGGYELQGISAQAV